MLEIGKIKTKAHLTTEITELEKKNHEIARKAACEGIVLLENTGVLPLERDQSIALYGVGATNTIKGGSGSGEVKNRASVSIYEGLKKEGFVIINEKMLLEYEKKAASDKKSFFKRQQKEAGLLNFKVSMASMERPYVWPDFPLLTNMDKNAADVCIYVISRISGEGYDRKLEKGDYYLDDTEVSNIRLCRKIYKKLIIVINAGGMVDLSAIDDVKKEAVVYIAMPGCAGGEAFSDIISGKVCPSGKLTGTWPAAYDDVPFGRDYSYLNGNVDKEYYKEGIFVGYRYFDTFHIKPKYAFGHGLSYTSFEISTETKIEKEKITVFATVMNTGSVGGKEVVQIYVSCPDGKLEKEEKRLVAFGKTKSLMPGEKQEISISFSLANMASYDVENAETILESGEYILLAGNASDNTSVVAVLMVEENIVISKHENICPLKDSLIELRKPAMGKRKLLENAHDVPRFVIKPDVIQTTIFEYKKPDIYHDPEVDKLMKKLSVEEMADIVVGVGLDMLMPMKHYYTVPGATGYSTNKFIDRGIKDIAFCDGPAGLRFQQQSVALEKKNKVKAITSSIDTLEFLPSLVRRMAFGKATEGTPLYQYATAFPTGTLLAQTWNIDLVEEVGQAANAELEEYGVTFWLAPGMNIHRNLLCGRNYEYYSEDPLLTGKIAAAMTRGVQSKGNHSVSLKHYCCNNQETNRGKMSSVVSERALREIYLTGFEIAVKEGKAQGVMTSYNQVNGVFTAVSNDLLTKVLNCEWGFDGLTMTDWDNAKEGYTGDAAVAAGLSIQMAGEEKLRKQIRKALKDGSLSEEDVKRQAAQVFRRIALLDWEK